MIFIGIVDQKPNNVNKFWMLYRDTVIGSEILEKNTEWYMKPGQVFHFDGFYLSCFRGYDFVKLKDPVHYSQNQIETTDHQIDQLVYELFGLTEEEGKIVEWVVRHLR